jgi:hypothetical protein
MAESTSRIVGAPFVEAQPVAIAAATVTQSAARNGVEDCRSRHDSIQRIIAVA